MRRFQRTNPALRNSPNTINQRNLFPGSGSMSIRTGSTSAIAFISMQAQNVTVATARSPNEMPSGERRISPWKVACAAIGNTTPAPTVTIVMKPFDRNPLEEGKMFRRCIVNSLLFLVPLLVISIQFASLSQASQTSSPYRSDRKHLLAIGDAQTYGYQHDAVSHALSVIERLGRE